MWACWGGDGGFFLQVRQNQLLDPGLGDSAENQNMVLFLDMWHCKKRK